MFVKPEMMVMVMMMVVLVVVVRSGAFLRLPGLVIRLTALMFVAGSSGMPHVLRFGES